MSLIEWRSEFRIGVPGVDYEHETLIKLINGLHAAQGRGREKPDVLNFLGEVHAMISAHFALEERMMLEHHYDDYASHKADHERLLDEIRDIMDQVEADPAFTYEEALSRRLADWFGVHFKTFDARLHNRLG